MEFPNEPPKNDAEYSGPYEGDERDPKPLSETIPEAATEIARRSQAETSELLQARDRYKSLEDKRAAGEPVSDTEIEAAKSALAELEAKHRKWQPPEG